MASLRLVLVTAGGGLILASASASPVRSDPTLSRAPVVTQVSHQHSCPCWSAQDTVSQQQLCTCGVHRSIDYGQQCQEGPSSAGSFDGGGDPAGGDRGPMRPFNVRPLPEVSLATPNPTRSRCAAIAADGKVTRDEAKDWRRLNCARFYPLG